MLCVVISLLTRRLPPVAIAAAHIAFRDLVLDLPPREAIFEHPRDIGALRTAMVKLKNDWVALTAINTRMVTQVHEHTATIFDGCMYAVLFHARLLMV